MAGTVAVSIPLRWGLDSGFLRNDGAGGARVHARRRGDDGAVDSRPISSTGQALRGNDGLGGGNDSLGDGNDGLGGGNDEGWRGASRGVT